MIAIRNKLSGFTLLEVILVVALLTMIAGFSWPWAWRLKYEMDFNQSVELLADALDLASIKSEAMVDDQSWGVKLSTEGFTIFAGEDFVNRQENFDENVLWLGPIEIAGQDEIVFNKMTGLLPTEVQLTLSSPMINKQKTIIIDEMGKIK